MMKVKKDFTKKVLTLMTGTAAAQLINILSSPLLTRIFTPEEMGIFATFSSIISILSVLISLRMEQTILLPNTEKRKKELLLVTILLISINSFILSLMTFIFYYCFSINIFNIGRLILLLPITLFLIVFTNTMRVYMIGVSKFKANAKNTFYNALVTVMSQIVLGLFNFLFNALIIGKLLGQLFIVGVLYKNNKNLLNLSKLNKKIFLNLRIYTKKYKHFIMYGTPQAFLTSISINYVPLLLSYFFQNQVVGLYALAYKILFLPVTLMGNSVKDVYINKTSLQMKSKQSIYFDYLKITFILLVIFLPFLIVILIFGKFLFPVVFGSEWAGLSEISNVLIFWLLFIFISRPTVSLFQLLELQKLYLNIEIISTVLKISSFVLSYHFFNSFYATITTFVLANIIHYVGLITIIQFKLKKYEKNRVV